MLPKRPSNTILIHTYKSFPFLNLTKNHLCFANCIEVRTEYSLSNRFYEVRFSFYAFSSIVS